MKRSIKITVAMGSFMVACAHEPQQTRPAQAAHGNATTNAGPNELPASTAITPDDAPPTTAPNGLPVSATMSDSQLAGIADAANESEIAEAKIAVRRAKDERVRSFAKMMLDHHSNAKISMASLGIADEKTATSSELEREGQVAVQALTDIPAGKFDQTYIDSQVLAHRNLLDLFDSRLIAAARAPGLKQALTDFRPKVAEHLKRAEDLQQLFTKP